MPFVVSSMRFVVSPMPFVVSPMPFVVSSIPFVVSLSNHERPFKAEADMSSRAFGSRERVRQPRA